MNQRNKTGSHCTKLWVILYLLMSKRNSLELPLGIFLKWECEFVGLGKDIVFRFILEYSSSLRDCGP
jgi:hypothetical protein